MKAFLNWILKGHLRPRTRWLLLPLILSFVALAGLFRIERKLDLLSLLPANHPQVKANLEAGLTQGDLVWVVLEGDTQNLEARTQWAERLLETMMERQEIPLNGLMSEGRMIRPSTKDGLSPLPQLLAAGNILEGDDQAGRLATEWAYGLAPILLGDRMAHLTHTTTLREIFFKTAQDLRSPQPWIAGAARLDPLNLRQSLPEFKGWHGRAESFARQFPFHLRCGFLESRDSQWLLIPLLPSFPSTETQQTARHLAWISEGAQTEPPDRITLPGLEQRMAIRPDRNFSIQFSGAHATAYWESQRLSKEVLLSLGLSFLLIGAVYWLGFRSLLGYALVMLPVLLGMFWTLGLMGWILGRLNLMAAAFGAVLLGVGDDFGILILARYREERMRLRSPRQALRSALLGTGPGVVAGCLTTALAFLSLALSPFPGLRDLGLTAGLGLMFLLMATLLILPRLLLFLDRPGSYLRRSFFQEAHRDPPTAQSMDPSTGNHPIEKASQIQVQTWVGHHHFHRLRPYLAVALLLLASLGIIRLRWEEDLRKLRTRGNPVVALQARLSDSLQTSLQPLSLQIQLSSSLPQTWNALSRDLQPLGIHFPPWTPPEGDLARILASETWRRKALEVADQAGLDPTALERPLAALQLGSSDPVSALRNIQQAWNFRANPPADGLERVNLPLRIRDGQIPQVMELAEKHGIRLVGTQPLFIAVKKVARDAVQQAIGLSLLAIFAVTFFFGRRLRFLLMALMPLGACLLGSLGGLGWMSEPLTFISLTALPIALGVSVDTAYNLLHRARTGNTSGPEIAQVNAVCAGTTLAGFGGLILSTYGAFRGLGWACLGGVGLALLITQWILPELIRRWPLRPQI